MLGFPCFFELETRTGQVSGHSDGRTDGQTDTTRNAAYKTAA